MQDALMTTMFVGLTFLFAGIVKGIVGMGLPTVAMGLLGMAMLPVDAAALLIIPSLVTNLWQLIAGPRFVHLLKRFATMMIGVTLGTFAGVGLLTSRNSYVASIVLGVVLVIYSALGLMSIRFRVAPAMESRLSPLIGFATGVLTGAAGIFVVPAVPYLNSLGLDKDELIQSLGLSFTVSTVALALGLLAHGEFPSSVAAGSLLALLPALAGMLIGQRVRTRLSQETFRRWFLSGLLALGFYMVLRPFMSL
jgi:uncharacterized membrane protein YfcA